MSMNSLKAVNPLVKAFISDVYRDFPKIPEWLAFIQSPAANALNENGVSIAGLSIRDHQDRRKMMEIAKGKGKEEGPGWESRMALFQSLSREKVVFGMTPADGGLAEGSTGMQIGGLGFEDYGGFGGEGVAHICLGFLGGHGIGVSEPGEWEYMEGS